MGRNKTKTCNVCFKSMRIVKLERHMMRRDHLMCNNEGTGGKVVNEDNFITNGLHDGKIENNVANNEEQISFTIEKYIALENELLAEWREFNKKIELGQ